MKKRLGLYLLVSLLAFGSVLFPVSCGGKAPSEKPPVEKPPAEKPAAEEPATPPATPVAIPHTLEGRADCLVCHQTGVGGASKIPADHSGRTNDACTTCHESTVKEPAAPTPTAIPHTLDGRADCLMCHTSGTFAVPTDHAGRGNNTCTTCHQPKS